MPLGWPLWLLLVACGETETDGELSLDGPARVSVDRFGPVEGPTPVDEDGHEVHDVQWTARPRSVARVRDGEIHAVGPGEAVIRGRRGDDAVEWTLRVEPAILLSIHDPPATLRAGQTFELAVHGRYGDEQVAPGPLEWQSSDPDVLTVDDRGTLRARTPGVAYVTVSGARTQAMVEIVVAP